MNTSRDVWRGIGLFCALTFIFSAPFWLLIARAGEVSAGDKLLWSGLTWCPALAALATQRLRKRGLDEFGWKRGKWRYQFMSYLIPLGYIGTVYAIVWSVYPGSFYDHEFVENTAKTFGWSALSSGQIIAAYVILQSTAGMVGVCARALGEEIGWRGFLVPQLNKVTGFTGTAVISGVIWAVWHFPILIFADYHGDAGILFGLMVFTTAVVADSFLYAWMRLRSGSLWTGLLLHGSFNLFSYRVFDSLTVETGIEHIVGEFGVGLMFANLLIAVVVWTIMRDRVMPKRQAETAMVSEEKRAHQ